MTIDEVTLVPCKKASKRITTLCRQYGLTEEQWQKGFLRHYHNDRWVVEEEICELSLTCDHVFNARLQEELYRSPVEMFDRCQASLPVEPERRDYFEKKYAEGLKEIRGNLVHFYMKGVYWIGWYDLCNYFCHCRAEPHNPIFFKIKISVEFLYLSGPLSYKKLRRC